eukprot:4923257-Amphidinium_carterae.1
MAGFTSINNLKWRTHGKVPPASLICLKQARERPSLRSTVSILSCLYSLRVSTFLFFLCLLAPFLFVR